MRILITGSRHWKNWIPIREALTEAVKDYWDDQPIVVVHGAQVTEDWVTKKRWGTDYIADRLAGQMGAVTDPHPAKWKELGKKAGPIRNQQMVDAGADVCLAFPMGKSVGTRDCMARAEKAGIPVINYGDL